MMSRSILLVEDNPDDVELVQLALRDQHIDNEIIVARDGVESIDILTAGRKADPGLPSRKVGLVLLDLGLPRLDGFEVLTRVRSDPRIAHVPVVILSSSRLPRDVERGYRLGASGYVVKDVDFGRLSEAMGNVGRFWLRLNQLPD